MTDKKNWLQLLAYATRFHQPRAALAERARREFSERKYAAAEQDFRELTRIDPSNIYAYMFLGQSLFSQEKYAEAVEPYQKARELEKKLLVQSEEVHTERGTHAKILRSWSNWSRRVGFTRKLPGVEESKEEFERLLQSLNDIYDADGRLPWSD